MLAPETIVEQALRTLAAGGTLLYPTDTIWGIGCDAANADAIEKIYAIKQRDHSKSMLVLALQEWVECDSPRLNSLFASPDRPITVIVSPTILPSLPAVATNLPAADGTVGIRVPRHAFCQQLLRALGHPIVSTSANFSGQPSPSAYDEISPLLKQRIDYCVEPLAEFASGNSHGSRIVRLETDGTLTILRD